jgi:hypothetical protein
MSNQRHSVKEIVWNEVFRFPHIFKSFKMAIQPAKLLVGVLFLATVCGGGLALDAFWSMTGNSVDQDEANLFVILPPAQYEAQQNRLEETQIDGAAALLAGTRQNRLAMSSVMSFWLQVNTGVDMGYSTQAYRTILNEYTHKKEKKLQDPDTYPCNPSVVLDKAKKDGDSVGNLLDDAKKEFEKEIDKAEALQEDVEDAAKKLITDAKLKGDERDDAIEAVELAAGRMNQAISLRKKQFHDAMQKIEGVGVFACLSSYLDDWSSNALVAVRHLNFTGGLEGYQRILAARSGTPITSEVESGVFDSTTFVDRNASQQPGLIVCLLMMVEGIRWLILAHPMFALLFLPLTLAAWALFGGAVYRMAAIHFARDEKLSAVKALRFSASKFFSSMLTVIVPVVVIWAFGLLLTLNGLIGSCWGVGELIMSILFGVTILIGMVMAFLLVGFVAGSPLTFPTIAVEGSDTFDAISRSISYVFARPFRAAFYGVVAVIYGTLTYLFVRFFVYVGLLAVHAFVKFGVIGGGSSVSSQADGLDVLWHRPEFWDLHTPNWHALSGFETISACIIAFWVIIVAAIVASYLLTYFASSSTCIYFLLRRQIDSTDLDDVYIEEPADEVPEVKEEPAAEEPAPESPAEETPAPAEEEPAGS